MARIHEYVGRVTVLFLSVCSVGTGRRLSRSTVCCCSAEKQVVTPIPYIQNNPPPGYIHVEGTSENKLYALIEYKNSAMCGFFPLTNIEYSLGGHNTSLAWVYDEEESKRRHKLTFHVSSCKDKGTGRCDGSGKRPFYGSALCSAKSRTDAILVTTIPAPKGRAVLNLAKVARDYCVQSAGGVFWGAASPMVGGMLVAQTLDDKGFREAAAPVGIAVTALTLPFAPVAAMVGTVANPIRYGIELHTDSSYGATMQGANSAEHRLNLKANPKVRVWTAPTVSVASLGAKLPVFGQDPAYARF